MWYGKKVFSFNPDISKNAYLNWRTDKTDIGHNFHELATGYAEAAFKLIECILHDNSDKKADALIFPVMYCIDQSIEVYLKAIILTLKEISGDSINIPTTHDLKQLKNEMKACIKKVEKSIAGLEKHLKPITSFIDELYNEIEITNLKGKPKQGIDFARYPISQDGTPHFYVSAENNVVIDVENLNNRFSEIENILESLYLMYDEMNHIPQN